MAPDASRQAKTRQAAELLADPFWRLENLYWIKDENGKTIQFKLNWAQRNFLRAMWYLNIILKARQLGFTTAITLFMLDACLFNKGVSAGIIADTESKAQEIFRDKIKFAYDRLPSGLRQAVETVKDSVHGFEFSNGSSIQVGTSMRGLTKQYLLITELGKIAAENPAKATEIRTGSLNTVHAGNYVFIESTAKGREGMFYEFVEVARQDQREGRKLTPMSYKFHFYPWFLDDRYMLSPEHAANVVLTDEDRKYFERIEAETDSELDDGRRAWYVEKRRTQQEDMKSEYPSTPDEAFESSGEGRIYRREMAKLRDEGRLIERIPVIPNIPVHSFWDIGGAGVGPRSDYMSIWLSQRVSVENRMIGYYQNNGYGLAHYVTWLREQAKDRGFVLGKFFLPHDAEQKRLTGKNRGQDVTEMLVECGVPVQDIIVVPRVEDKWQDGIGSVRNIFPTLVIDKTFCADGVKCADNYKREWNDQVAAWRNHPVHDEASHGCDALETFARSNVAVEGNRAGGTTPKRKRARSAMSA